MVESIGMRNDSRLVVALDIYSPRWSIDWLMDFLGGINKYVVGVKIGIPTILSYGLDKISGVINRYNDLLWVADVKLADIGYVGKLIVDKIYESGFNAIIIHGFTGFEDGVGETVAYASRKGLYPIIVAAMSHKGAQEYLNRVSGDIILNSLNYPVDGYILPATYREYISFYRGVVGNRVILSPGIGKQGAEPGSAIKYGADLEIVGRLIYMDEAPISRVRELHGVLRWRQPG